jgi:hypothetical protein
MVDNMNHKVCKENTTKSAVREKRKKITQKYKIQIILVPIPHYLQGNVQ